MNTLCNATKLEKHINRHAHDGQKLYLETVMPLEFIVHENLRQNLQPGNWHKKKLDRVP